MPSPLVPDSRICSAVAPSTMGQQVAQRVVADVDVAIDEHARHATVRRRSRYERSAHPVADEGHRAAARDGALPARRHDGRARPRRPSCRRPPRAACSRRSRTPGSPSATSRAGASAASSCASPSAPSRSARSPAGRSPSSPSSPPRRRSRRCSPCRAAGRARRRRPGRRAAPARHHELGRPADRRPPRLGRRQAAARRARRPRRWRPGSGATRPRAADAATLTAPGALLRGARARPRRRAGPRSTASPSPAWPPSRCPCATPDGNLVAHDRLQRAVRATRPRGARRAAPASGDDPRVTTGPPVLPQRLAPAARGRGPGSPHDQCDDIALPVRSDAVYFSAPGRADVS